MAKKDVVWRYCVKVDDPKGAVRCKLCNDTFKNGRPGRMKAHLAKEGDPNIKPCDKVPENLRRYMSNLLKGLPVDDADLIEVTELNDGTDLNVITDLNDLNENSPVYKTSVAVGKFLLSSNIPFTVMTSPFFKDMLETIALNGPKIARNDNMQEWVLNEIDKQITNKVKSGVELCKQHGCSVLLHEFLSENSERYVTVTIFTKGRSFVLDTFIDREIISQDCLIQLIAEVLEFLGPKNVWQIITNCDKFYHDALNEVLTSDSTFSWTPSVDQSVELLLTDLKNVEWIHQVIEKAQAISKFVYSDATIFEVTKEGINSAEMIIWGPSATTTDFLTLQQLLSLKDSLKGTVESNKWLENQLCQTPEGNATKQCILEASFWEILSNIVSFTQPLLTLLTTLQTQPQLGRASVAIYMSKLAMKQQIAEDYEMLVDMVDKAFPVTQLFGAGMYLTPVYFRNATPEVKDKWRQSFMLWFIGKYIQDEDSRTSAILQLESYHEAEDEFANDFVQTSTVRPDVWWSTFANKTGKLGRIAAEVLAQPTSLVGFRPEVESPEEAVGQNRIIRRLKYTKTACATQNDRHPGWNQWLGDDFGNPENVGGRSSCVAEEDNCLDVGYPFEDAVIFEIK